MEALSHIFIDEKISVIKNMKNNSYICVYYININPCFKSHIFILIRLLADNLKYLFP